MYRFVSSNNPSALKKAYLKKYNMPLLQGKLDKLLTAYPEIKAVLPEDLSAKKLLVSNFKYLTKVYCAFTNYLAGKSNEDRKTILESFVVGGFNYDSHKAKIGDFLKNSANGFEIHNCVYCDLEDVTTFTKADGKKVRRFETEHVLDKGECPLVAMSLYNFVPSCGTCNGPDIKGSKTIGDTETEIAKLSPSAEGYDFETQVRFEIKMINPVANDLKAISHKDDYEVTFDVKDPLYQKSIDLFELKSRYNHGKEKTELLKWREMRRSNPDNIIRQMADLKKVTFEEMVEEMFELDLRRREHYTMEKARREVMLMY